MQRAWLLKLLAVELHAADMSSSTHREACQSIISELFGLGNSDDNIAPGSPKIAGAKMISKNQVMVATLSTHIFWIGLVMVIII